MNHDDPLTRSQKSELLWREYEYRHGVIWKTVQLWGAAVVVVLAVPFFQSKGAVSQMQGKAALIFPMIGLMLSIVGSWNIHSESERLSVVSKAYDDARGFRPPWPFDPIGGYERAVSISTAKTLGRVFFWGLGSASIASGLLTIWMNFSTTRPQSIAIFAGAALLFVFGVGISFREIIHHRMPSWLQRRLRK